MVDVLGYREIRDWTFPAFSVVLLQTIVIYLLAALALPEHGAHDTAVDLRKHYYESRRWFFVLLLALILVSLVKSLVVEDKLPDPVDLGFHAFFILLSSSGIAIRAPRFHEVLAAVGLVTIGTYIAVLFVHLR